jgi:protein involved in polysaccharide export with SLBB domain
MQPCVLLMGRIDQPGIHRYEARMTVRHLVDKAGGVAAESRLVIWRVVNGQRVQLDATLDSPLQPNDAVEIKVEPIDIPLFPRMPTESLINLLRARGFSR